LTLRKLTSNQRQEAKRRKAERDKKILVQQQFEVLFAAFSYVASCDGDVNKAEVKYVSNYLGNLEEFSGLAFSVSTKSLGSTTAEALIRRIKLGPIVYSQLRVRKKIIEANLELAVCDGELLQEEERAVQYIATLFLLTPEKFRTLKSRWHSRRKAEDLLKRGKGKESSFGGRSQVESDRLIACYKLLQCSPGDSMDKIKRAYRRLASEHHPDKHAAANLSKEEERRHIIQFQRIQAAFDSIKKNSRA
jgi:DnaJ-domain-containing protein 1